MSSRALRRLQEGTGVQGLPCSEPFDGDDGGEEETVNVPFTGARSKLTAPHRNPFDLVRFFCIMICLIAVFISKVLQIATGVKLFICLNLNFVISLSSHCKIRLSTFECYLRFY